MRAKNFRLRCAIFVVGFVCAVSASLAQSAPKILSITGYDDDLGVSAGRWTGQPTTAPPKASNNYLNDLAWDTYSYGSISASPSYWDINGRNFGTAEGSVWLTHRPSGPSQIALTVVSWTDTRIRVKPKGAYSFAYFTFTSEPVRVNVRTAPTRQNPQGGSDGRDENVVGIIKTRGYGQCTWFVARTRLGQNLAIPPSAYSTTGAIPAVGAIDNGYRPKQWDALTYGTNHVAIITTVPVQTTNTDGSISWSFTVREMNARWDEVESSSPRTYKVSYANLAGVRRVLIGIGTNASSSWVATGYFR